MFCGKEINNEDLWGHFSYENYTFYHITPFLSYLLEAMTKMQCFQLFYLHILIHRPFENFPMLKVEIVLRTPKRWEFVFWPCKSGPNHIVSPSIHINFWWCMMTVKISFLFFPLSSMSISPPWIHSSQYVDVFPRLINNMDVSLEKRGSYGLPTYVIITPTTNFFCIFSCHWSGVPLLSKLLFRYR